MQDLPENHFQVSGASWVNITNYFYFIIFFIIYFICPWGSNPNFFFYVQIFRTPKFCWAESASYDQTICSSRGGPVWSEAFFSSAELTHSICRLADLACQFWQQKFGKHSKSLSSWFHQQIISVKELQTCQYEVEVFTPLLCANAAYKWVVYSEELFIYDEMITQNSCMWPVDWNNFNGNDPRSSIVSICNSNYKCLFHLINI